MAAKRILCVEDQHDICELIKLVLREFEVMCAPTVREALKRIGSADFSLYLIDYHLPDGDELRRFAFFLF